MRVRSSHARARTRARHYPPDATGSRLPLLVRDTRPIPVDDCSELRSRRRIGDDAFVAAANAPQDRPRVVVSGLLILRDPRAPRSRENVTYDVCTAREISLRVSPRSNRSRQTTRSQLLATRNNPIAAEIGESHGVSAIGPREDSSRVSRLVATRPPPGGLWRRLTRKIRVAQSVKSSSLIRFEKCCCAL